MIRSAVTVSLVEEARGGPFVFWDGLAAACRTAGELGFDGIEIFAPSADRVDRAELEVLLEQCQLVVAAVGTGAGMVRHGLSLTDSDPDRRTAAKDFVRQIIEFGSHFGAPAIIGSMQGKWGGELNRDAALDLLRGALDELGPHAESCGTALIYEPLNRYETNLVNTVSGGVALLDTLSTGNVFLLADLFHMNIEEANIASAIAASQGKIGHLHFVDSNRQAAGLGHLDFAPIASAVQASGYDGFVSVEAFPLPDSDTAALRSIEAFNKHFR